MFESLIPISLFTFTIMGVLIGSLFIYEQIMSIINQRKTQELEHEYKRQQIKNEIETLDKLSNIEHRLERVLKKLEESNNKDE